MNWFGLVTVALGFAAYFLGLRLARKPITRGSAILVSCGAVLLALPGIVYDLYYSKLLGEPIWLYRIRSVPGTELLASLAGLLAGWAQVRLAPHVRLSPVGKRFLVPVVLGFALSLPYLKPLLQPLRPGRLREEWKDEVCLQSTPSTCGPAAAATIVRRLGGHLSERELAQEAFTSSSGTEIWYLARALRRHSYDVGFLLSDPVNVSLPAIAGVRLRSVGNSGHFVAVLERSGENFVIADPMEALSTNTLAELEGSYHFTGSFLSIRARDTNR